MKKRSFLLTLVAAVSMFALLPTPAEAGGRRDCYRGWHNGYGYYHRGWYPRYRYYRPYYRPAYYYPARRYRPGFYIATPVFAFGFR